MYRMVFSGVLAFMVLWSSPVYAIEPLSTEELISHCVFYAEDPDGEDGIFCVRYIQGFIDGAIATDERVTKNVADEYGRSDSFTARAIRTRLTRRTERFPSYYAEFCLGVPVPLKTVVELVVKDLLDTENATKYPLARNLVYATLRREYPCIPDADE